MRFLDALAELDHPVIVSAQTGSVLAETLELAVTSAARRKGLLGRTGLPSGAALLISRCNAIHTISMKFAIDVLFVDGSGCVKKIVHGLQPARIAFALSARHTIEFAAGELARHRLKVGDRVYLAPLAAAP
jgi:uncharacterized membrane protein (UPF0127 family)